MQRGCWLTHRVSQPRHPGARRHVLKDICPEPRGARQHCRCDTHTARVLLPSSATQCAGCCCCADLLRHPWTVGKGDPADFDQLISQMDEMMVHDPSLAEKLEAMGGAAGGAAAGGGAAGGAVDVDVDVALESAELEDAMDDGGYDGPAV